MARDNLSDLAGFLTVAREASFTKAAAQLGISQSALSHAIRKLESKLGVRLLTRTTRSVSPTSAGELLIQSIGSHFEAIHDGLASLSVSGAKPAGMIRITASNHAAETILWPALREFLPHYPDIRVELSIDSAMTDIAANRLDAGVRLGEHLAPGMVAVRIGPDWRLVVVGSPSYFANRAAPKTPQDLADHACINLRLATHGGLYAWEFTKRKREVRVKVEGPLTFNLVEHNLNAAVAGFGLAYVPEDIAQAHVREGRLVKVLEDWCAPFPGYHLYYPSRRHASPAFALFVDAVRYRG